MSDNPLVSVIIPCYQAEKYVRQAVESALNQAYPNIEVIAVDDGSTDSTLAILREYADNLTVLWHPGGVNLGVSRARKLGIDYAKGVFIAYLDADDFFEPGKVAIQVELLQSHPEVVLCHTGINQVNDMSTGYDGENWFNYTGEIDQYDLRKSDNYLRANRVCNSSVMIRADAARSIPFAGEQIFQFEDWLAWTLAAEYGDFIFTPQRLLNYRVHKDSATSTILSCRLKRLYSYVEFYLNVAIRSQHHETRQKCLVNLLEKLDEIQGEYEKSSGQKNSEDDISALMMQMMVENKSHPRGPVSKPFDAASDKRGLASRLLSSVKCRLSGKS